MFSAYLDTRVKVDMGGKRGRMTVEFADLDDLERIYKLMVTGPPSPQAHS
jgi:ParB family chromosome partitioning protein